MSEHFKIISDCLDRMEEKDAEIERLRAARRLIERKASQFSGTNWVAVEEIAREALGDE